MPPSFPPFIKKFGKSIRHTKNAGFSTRQLELQRKQKTKAKTNVAGKSFQQTSCFPKFSVKQAVRKLSSINFNYTYKFHLVLFIRIFFDKNMIYLEI